MQIHERLKASREDADKTQEQLAQAIGCTRKQISRYEKGEQIMTIEKLRNLCLYLDISADYVLGLPKDMKWPKR